MIKTMKSRLFVTVLLAVLALGVTTSCEDMFDIDSNRVAYDHKIDSSVDSVYSTLGVLQCVRKVADRYVILGEARGDLAVIDEKRTETALRNLANFDFDADNKYLNVRDYYAIINNCNYVLANMDASLKLGNQYVLEDEYAAMLGIRAWTYLQLAINYGEVPYYTYPLISESDIERAKAEEKRDIQFITADLAPELISHLDVKLPSFVATTGSYPVLRLVLAELYLWSRDYVNAAKYYREYFMENPVEKLVVADGEERTLTHAEYISTLGGKFATWNGREPSVRVSASATVTEPASAKKTEDYLAAITVSGELSSEVMSLFFSGHLQPSPSWKSLSAKQWVFNVTDNGGTKSIKSTEKVGDMRRFAYLTEGVTMAPLDEGGESEKFDIYTKHSNRIVFQRRSIACLRWAEAMNALAREQFPDAYAAGDSARLAEARMNAMNAFYLLKDASQVFFPEGSELRTEFENVFEKIQTSMYVGIHARGAGDVYYDQTHYVLTPNRIAERLGIPDSTVTFNDTIQYIDELIIDELALESTLEGNRFGDLIRFAERREDWGEDGKDFLAGRVADRSGERNDSLYNALSGSKDLWYLPFK